MRGVLVPGVSAAWKRGCADKLAMAQMLERIGVSTPPTVSGADDLGISRLSSSSELLVVKHRPGSGSSGLAMVRPDMIREATAAATRTAPVEGSAAPGPGDVVVQPWLPGVAHGVDIVGSLRSPGELCAVLARRKVRMRTGETDKAVSTSPRPFRAVAERIAAAAEVSGLIDVDMFLEEDGTVSVIDINPRFGGGYPFVHLAGADVPRFYLAAAFGVPDGGGWAEYVEGVTSAKFEGVRVTSAAAIGGAPMLP